MSRSTARFLCILLSVAVLLAALPFTVYAESNVRYAGSTNELAEICNEINQNGGEYTINLTADIEGGHIGITNSNAEVTIFGNGHKIDRSQTVGTAIYAKDGATINLGSADGKEKNALTIVGSNDDSEPGIIEVWPDSTCHMYDNVTLKDHKGCNYLGGGVTVQGGTFYMHGGTIKNCGIDGGSVCYGGGVAVLSNGTFIMDDGVITECYVNSNHIDDSDPNRCFTAMGGGVFVTAGSVFTMNGGTISNCEATNFGGGVAMVMLATDTSNSEYRQMGMGNPQSIVTINGGTITGNSADNGAGVFASGYFYSYASGVAYTLPESGSTAQPGLYINGSTISNNKADDMGGGILIAMLRAAIKAQIHNAEIKNNTADNGAGIENFGYWTQMDIDGCTITGNTAVTKGGGIMLSTNSSGGYTNLKNTTITGNTSGDRGAGVYYDANSEIRISGADVIQNNEFNGKLNNLNVYSLDKPVKVIGELTGSQIGLSDPTLWDDGKEDYDADAVSTLRLTDGYKANNALLIPADVFTSDHESWYVDFGEKKTEQGAEIGRTYTYTARKYAAISRATGSQVARGSLVDVVAKTTFSSGGKASSITELYEEITTRYKEEYQETSPNQYYDPVSGSNIEVLPYSNGVYVYVDNNILFAGVSYQGYVDEGHFALVFLSGTLDSAEFSDDYTEETVILDEQIDDDDTEYEFNDIGHTISKTEIYKSSEVVDIQYETVTTDYTNEVRLVRKTTVDYHINNDDIANAKYQGDDIFTDEIKAAGTEVNVDNKITSFYTVPEVPTDTNSCPYIFKGWYYDKANNMDSNPVVFGTDKYTAGRDIYAHWIKVEDVEKDSGDLNILPPGQTKYGGFDLSGVQVRGGIIDTNYDDQKMPGGLRFVTSLSMDVVNQINAIKNDNIEYGYVAATNENWIKYHKAQKGKLLYASETANGIDTSSANAANENYFGFAKNINCTSEKSNSQGIVKEDHRNYNGYLLYTLVITYENADDAAYNNKVLARPYIKYTDANGLERVAYSEYRGKSNTLGGCYTSYNAVAN